MNSVSVVIPTYNRSRLVLRAALSALLQSEPPDEVIIVDDCSTDDTEATVTALIAAAGDLFPKAAVIRYLRLPRNSGANTARNLGVREATHKWIAFLDSDDIWHPRKLEMQMARIAERDLGDGRPIFSYTGRFRVNDRLSIVARQFAGSLRDARKLRSSNSVGTLSSIVVDRWLLRHIGGFDERLAACQDWDMFLRAMDYCAPVGVPQPLVMYYDAAIDRITLNYRRRIISHIQIYRRYIRSHAESSGDLSEFYRNIAEDLSLLGRRKLAIRFYAAYLAHRHNPLVARAVAALTWRTVKNKRYSDYAARRQSEEGDAARAAEDAAFLREYVELSARCDEIIRAVEMRAGALRAAA